MQEERKNRFDRTLPGEVALILTFVLFVVLVLVLFLVPLLYLAR